MKTLKKLNNYLPLTPAEVADALAIENLDNMAERIAQDMLDGHVSFKRKELKKLAKYKGVTPFQLVELDDQLKRYRLS